jgi:hypothetical protein
MRYRKVSTRIWADDRFLRLSKSQPSAQTLFLYLITGPHSTSLPGLFVAGEAMLAEALGWDTKGFREAFGELFRDGSGNGHDYPLAMADWDSRLVFLPRAIRHNPPENPNVIKGWKAIWTELPECSLKSLAYAVFEAEIALIGDGHAKAFADSIERPKGFRKGSLKDFIKGLGNGMPNQEQEQEQEQEKNLALFLTEKDAAPGKEPKRRGRPPKDQSPEATAEREAEKADGERWMAKARSILGLDETQARWSTATWMAFRRARKARGIEQLMQALEGLTGDKFSATAGLGWLISDNGITKGLAKFSAGASGVHVSRVQHRVGSSADGYDPFL